MGITKTKITEYLAFIFLVLFPFGQIFRVNLNAGIRLQPLDLVALVALLLYGLSFRKYWVYFLAFSFGGFVFMKNRYDIFPGIFYLVRIFSYTCLGVGFYSLGRSHKSFKTLISNGLLAVSLITAFFAWAQYLYLPDVRWLKLFGWDDHLYRMVGTFLDPGFLGIILVIGFTLSFFRYVKGQKNLLLVAAFLLVSVAFTYSRASFLALLFGIFTIGAISKKYKVLITFLLLFIGMIFVLPRPSSEGVKLERLHSVDSRLENYQETATVFLRNPIFGVGFNNLCRAKIEYFGNTSIDSHACSGSDSSVLLILSTTGVVGILLILGILSQIVQRISFSDSDSQLFLITLGTVLVHSQFTNSLFYPWVLGWLGILGVGLRVKLKS